MNANLEYTAAAAETMRLQRREEDNRKMRHEGALHVNPSSAHHRLAATDELQLGIWVGRWEAFKAHTHTPNRSRMARQASIDEDC